MGEFFSVDDNKWVSRNLRNEFGHVTSCRWNCGVWLCLLEPLVELE